MDTTPSSASTAAQRGRHPRPVKAATATGPRNSKETTVPSGSSEIAA